MDVVHRLLMVFLVLHLYLALTLDKTPSPISALDHSNVEAMLNRELEQENGCSKSVALFFDEVFTSCSNSGQNSFSTVSDQSQVKAKGEQNIEQANNECNVSASQFFTSASCSNEGLNTLGIDGSNSADIDSKSYQTVDTENDCDDILNCFNNGDNIINIKAANSNVKSDVKQNIDADNNCNDIDSTSSCSNNIDNTANIKTTNGANIDSNVDSRR